MPSPFSTPVNFTFLNETLVRVNCHPEQTISSFKIRLRIHLVKIGSYRLSTPDGLPQLRITEKEFEWRHLDKFKGC